MSVNQAQAAIDLPNKAYLLPQTVPMWPPVWWTWLIIAALVISIICLLVFFYRRHQKRAYRREALAVLSNATATHKINTDDKLTDKACILLCHELIRRCLISEGKHETAALPSSALLEKLDQNMPIKHRFSSLGDDFINGLYRQHIELTPAQRDAMLKVTRHWIRKHHA